MGATVLGVGGVVAVGCGDATTTQIIGTDHSRLEAFKEWFDVGHASGDNAQVLY